MCQAMRELLRDERNLGKKEGREEGKLSEIYSSIKEGDYGIDRGAQKLKISIEELTKRLQAAGFVL